MLSYKTILALAEYVPKYRYNLSHSHFSTTISTTCQIIMMQLCLGVRASDLLSTFTIARREHLVLGVEQAKSAKYFNVWR